MGYWRELERAVKRNRKTVIARAALPILTEKLVRPEHLPIVKAVLDLSKAPEREIETAIENLRADSNPEPAVKNDVTKEASMLDIIKLFRSKTVIGAIIALVGPPVQRKFGIGPDGLDTLIQAAGVILSVLGARHAIDKAKNP